MNRHKNFDRIEFGTVWAPPPAQHSMFGYGRTMRRGETWFYRITVAINGVPVDATAVAVEEFAKMLRKPGRYWPFTCNCGIPDCDNVDMPVRCYHRRDAVIMVIREPLRQVTFCESIACPDVRDCPFEIGDCPLVIPRYHAYCFERSKLVAGLREVMAFGILLN